MAEATTPPEILLVDDDAETRASLRELLILDGYRVEEASNGREALERVRVRRPNLVLLDVAMPEMDGYEVTRWLKSHLRRFVPVILLSATDAPELLQRGVEAGADEVLRKPIAATELRVRVRAMLRIARLTEDLRDEKRRVARLACTDELTGASNLRGFRLALAREFPRALRSGGDLTLLSFDVDHFKRINDVYGHPDGDRVLVQVARWLQSSLRVMDLLARVGGEEFVVIAPDARMADALAVGERLRQSCRNPIRLPGGELVQVSLSCGVASLSQFPGCSPERLVAMADRALYCAKANGRDRTEQARPAVGDEPNPPAESAFLYDAGIVRDLIEDETSLMPLELD
jgi:two-component system cell cycle response regulator